ncbi:MAG TPA: hypothetical protein VI461_06225 [Chitinophagaceae bacterium]|nr:hypothetical protein [Chitinophagaceae bacterium]
MKYKLLWIILLIRCTSAENNIPNNTPAVNKIETDSLSKYSYDLVGFKYTRDSVQPENSTCFFIKKNGHLFLVTAKHSITGCKNGKVSLNRPDTMYVMKKGTETETEVLVIVNLLNINKDGVICLPAEEDPDVKVMEVFAIPTTYAAINSVDKFLKNRADKAGDVEMFGFPWQSHYRKDTFIYPPPTHLFMSIEDITVADKSTFEATGKVDSINYRFVFNKPQTYIDYKGFSGSPVFFTDMTTGEKSIQGVFAQVTRDSVTKIQRSLEACKIEYVTKQIDSIILKIPR